MAPQRHDAAAWPTDVAEQQLQDAGRPNDLRAITLLGPAHGIRDRARPLPSGILRQHLSHLQEELLGRAAYPLHHLGGVASVVALQDLEDAARVLEAFVAGRLVLRWRCSLHPVAGVGRGIFFGFLRRPGVGPTGAVVAAGLRVVTREEAVVVFGVDVV